MRVAHTAVEAVQGADQRQPMLQKQIEVRRGIGIKSRQIPLCPQPRRRSGDGFNVHVVGGGRVQRIHDVHIVSPGLGPVFPGVGAGIGGHERGLPIRRRTAGVMAPQGLVVVRALVAEALAKIGMPVATANQSIPVVVRGLMAKVAENGAIGFGHRLAHALAHRGIGLGDIDGNEPVRMTGDHATALAELRGRIGQEIKRNPPRIAFPRHHRQAQAQQAIYQASLLGLQTLPQPRIARHTEVRDGAIQAAGPTERLGFLIGHHPVAHRVHRIVPALAIKQPVRLVRYPVGSRSRQNRMYSPAGRPGTRTATASASGKPVR